MVPLAAPSALAAQRATPALQSASATATQYERVLNGSFDTGSKSPWWSSGNTPSGVTDGKLCAQIPSGTVNPWDSMIGQDDVPLESGQPYTLLGTTSQVGGGGAELLLWVKVPGNSDGLCGTAPTIPAGQFSPDLAVQLINGT
jgi:hypothetical protein